MYHLLTSILTLPSMTGLESAINSNPAIDGRARLVDMATFVTIVDDIIHKCVTARVMLQTKVTVSSGHT